MKCWRIRISRKAWLSAAIFGLAIGGIAILTLTTPGKETLVRHAVGWLPKDRFRHAAGKFALAYFRRESIPVLLQLLRNRDPYLQQQAASIIAQTGDKAVVELVQSVQDERPQVRYWSVLLLGGMQAQKKIVVPPLIQALTDKECTVRAAAAESLGRFGPDATEAIARLCDLLLDDESSEVRVHAAQSLSQIDSEGKTAFPYLAQAMRDEDAEVRRAAREAFDRLNKR